MVNGDRWNAILTSAGCLGSARVSRVGFGVSPKRSLKSPRTRDGFASTRDGRASRKKSVRVEGAALSAPKNLGHDGACPSRFKNKKEMPDHASLAIRHLVDVQLAAAKTELCVTVVFFEL